MIQASRSPSKAAGDLRIQSAGPLEIAVRGHVGPALELIDDTLSLFDVPWSLTPTKRVSLSVEVVANAPPEPARGHFLECAQMVVDQTVDGLRATTTRGAEMIGRLSGATESWQLTIPRRIVDDGWWPEIEDLLSLVVTTGWRRAGWIPLHAAGLTRGSVGVIVCAGSRGGKTTFSLAMASRGWRLVGDDKLLLGRLDGRPVIAAVKHMLNVDPAVRTWFPEVGDLTSLPIYSQWSPKRRVPLASIWPEAPASVMTATHLVSLVRSEVRGAVSVQALGSAETIGALLRQSVIPTEARAARAITGALAGLAQGLAGYRVEVTHEAYERPDALADVDEVLR